MRPFRLVSVGLVVLLLGLILARGGRGDPVEAEPVSMVRILANPLAYDGKRVRIEGFVVVAHGESAIYLTKEHADFGILRNSLWLDFSRSAFVPAEYSGTYFAVEGTVDGARGGMWGLFPASIRSLTEIKRISPRGESRR